ncbi:hypothetical protein KI688_003641 [Linnemannia hyalina]|uniref:Uncharacterized protein n=1 Tax=Linnemannia hyalina TaxID=64524 RepID=A0A9P8BQY7_9FUNG|nr:hypothetical protein KI688_003641 [Linnemannia hyalina]
MAASIQRHSQVLQQIRLQSCHRLTSSTIHPILSSCRGLQHLEIIGGYPSRIAIALKDAGFGPATVGDVERLCLHIGSLQQLKFLDLRGAAVVVDTTYNNPPQEISYSKLTFPGLLRLGDASTGEPRYVSLLKDLKQLKTFQGSVWLNYVRVQERIVQAEVEWMYVNWPSLLLAGFLDYANQSALEERAYLRWLKERIPRLQFTKMVTPSTWSI